MCKIRDFVAEFYGLKVKNYLNGKLSNLIGVNNLLLSILQTKSTLLLHTNIDIILFANRLFLALM